MATVATSCKSQKGLIRISLRQSGVSMDSVGSTYSPSWEIFKPGTALARVLDAAPYLARCSDNKTAMRVRPREFALRYPYMQLNPSGQVSWLIFDLDHDEPMIWEAVGLPAPNLTVINRKSDHSHLYYAIPTVCTTAKGRAKPIAYMKAVYEAFALRLKADPAYSIGSVSKTPGHPWWDTTDFHDHVYDLGELADYVDLAVNKWRSRPKLDEVEHSRHCILFENLRHYAYSIVNQVRETGSYEDFRRMLEVFAHNSNSFHKHGFSQNLLQSSVRSTVKSVGRWTWDVYSGSRRCHRGVMGLDASMPLQERQRLAAKRTHEIRNKATESKIRAACIQLRNSGQKLGQAAIAALAKVTRQTVATYKHLLKEPLRAAAAIPIREVKYGARQIPAPVGTAIDLCVEVKNMLFARARDRQQPLGKKQMKNIEVHALRSAVLGVEQTNRQCLGKWEDWEDAQHVADTFEVELCPVGQAVIERAIATEGVSLDEDLAAVEHAVWGDGFARKFWERSR